MKDLVVLAADKQAEFATRGILSRTASLNTRSISADFFVHPGHDSGCLLKAAEFLAPFRASYSHALVILDREGCGQESRQREELEEQIEQSLARVGWLPPSSAAVVLDPELEIWVWSDSPEVETCLGWENQPVRLQIWLAANWQVAANGKPDRPKEAMQAALRIVRKPRSSAIFQKLAETVSLNRCSDPSFHKLRSTVATWFPTFPAASRD